MKTISVALIVVDAEISVLPRALESVKNFSNEIVLVDMTTVGISSIAKKYDAKVYKHDLVPYVEKVRNFAISKCTGEWILMLDPDEEVTSSLKKILKELTKKEEAHYYRLPRRNIVFNKWLRYSRWWPDYNIRFFKKGFVSWNEIIHAVPVTQGEGADLPDKEQYALIHHHYESIDQYLTRLNRYTSVQAERLLDDGYSFSWQDLFKKPSNEFLSRFFAGDGYRDGIHGLVVALLQGFSELILYTKIWEKQGFYEKEIILPEIIKTMKETDSDQHYWRADAMVKNGGGLTARVKRKFKLS